jgi:hypothetical protein
MEPDIDVVMNFDIHDPDRGMLTVPAYPLRQAPPLPQPAGAFKHVYRKLEKVVPVVGAYRLIEQRLEKGPVTIEELQQHVGCHKNTIMKLLARLRRSGQLHSTTLQPSKGRGARPQSHWIE